MKTIAVLAFFAIVAVSFGAVLKDITGGTYDLHTGQYSSALTGHVWNTAPVVAHAPVLAAPAYGYAHGYAAHGLYGGLYL